MLKVVPSLSGPIRILEKDQVVAQNLKPSIPPDKAVVPDRLFEYVRPPMPAITMESCNESYSFMMHKLNYLAERAKEYGKLPANDADRLCFECRHQIMVHLFRSTNRGYLVLEQLEESLLAQYKYKVLSPLLKTIPAVQKKRVEVENVDRWSACFRDAVLKVVDELGIVL